MKLSILGVSLLLTTSLYAGRETGNGGFAHVCRDSDGKITSARLLDLWEGEELETWSSPLPAAEQIDMALEKIMKLSPNVHSVVGKYLGQIRENIVFTKRPLVKTEDAFPPFKPGVGCDYEQVARFEGILTETGKRGLRIYREIYDSPSFTETDRAALHLHEAIYMADRLVNAATTSLRSRTLVAHLFSESPIPNAVRLAFGNLLNKESQWTEDLKSKKAIFAVPTPDDFGFKFHISELDGVLSYTGEPSASQKKSLYRCSAKDQPNFADTGWLTLEKILDQGAHLGDSDAPPFTLQGRYRADRPVGIPGWTVSYGITFSCKKKTKDGKVKPVSFKGYYTVDQAECLSEGPDGSLDSSTQEPCIGWLKSNNAKLEDHAAFEVLRALPLR